MGPVENEVNDQEYENDEISGTAGTDFENDWDVSHKSTPNQIMSVVCLNVNVIILTWYH